MIEPCPSHCVARLGDREEPLLEAHLPAAPALRAGAAAPCPALRATAPARLAAVPAGDGDRLLAAERGLLEQNLEVVAQVLAAARAASRAAPAAAEEVTEDVAEDVLEAGVEVEAAGPALLVERGMSESVVLRAPLGVAETW